MLEFVTCPCCHGYSDRPNRSLDRLQRFYVGLRVAVCEDCGLRCGLDRVCRFLNTVRTDAGPVDQYDFVGGSISYA